MPDGTILQNRGVGVRRGSGWQEIDGGMGGVFSLANDLS